MANSIKQKFIEHMELHRLSKEAQKGYISGLPFVDALRNKLSNASEGGSSHSSLSSTDHGKQSA